MPKNIKALPFFPPFHMAESGMLKDTQDLTSSTLNAWDGRHWLYIKSKPRGYNEQGVILSIGLISKNRRHLSTFLA